LKVSVELQKMSKININQWAVIITHKDKLVTGNFKKYCS